MNFKSGLIKIAIIVMILILEVSASVVKRSNGGCNASKMCHYGGICDWRGQCACQFDCQQKLWPGKIYCGPKENGSRRQYYYNICQLLAHACQIQIDIPVIEFSMERMQCEDDIPPKHSLCSNPKDHLGPCGGSTAIGGNVGAGVCLTEAQTFQKRCQCPNDKTGADCYLKATFREVNLSYDEEPGDASELRHAVKLVAVSVIGTLMIVISAFVITKSCKARRRRQSDLLHTTEHKRLSTPSEKDDLGLIAFGKQIKSTDADVGVPQGSISGPAQLTSKGSKASLMEQDLPRRGRLSGESLTIVPVITGTSKNGSKNSNVLKTTPRYENINITQNNNKYDKKRNNA